VLPRLQEKFSTVDHFLGLAHSVTNRRKSRSGKSLELHLAAIFREDALPFTNGATTEGARRPDFIFPSIEKYFASGWPDQRLRMLGAKTTVKDRWRQILNEARRVERKHLFTLQEGVSNAQFREMQDEGVTLVVPKPLHKHYPDAVRRKLLSLTDFIAETRTVCAE
jgi:type II restriction enzyme